MSSSLHKPRYVDPAGDPRRGALPVRPPFLMTGVTARVFPLGAQMARLTQFVDQYLNMDIPPEIVHYRPAAPYVVLMVLDYGGMAPASVQAQNMGWVAQHEVAFAIPLEQWRQQDGKLVFRGWSCVCPFIFVDDAMSLTTGREVYGWPKVAGVVDADVPLWAKHPTSATRLFTFSTHVFPKIYAGQAEALRVLLEVDVDPPPTWAQIIPDPGNPWWPMNAAATATRSTLSLAGSAIDMALGLRIRGFRTNRDPASLRAMGGEAGRYLREIVAGLLPSRGPQQAAGDPKLTFENITVKQFRDAARPDRACYQAIVTSAMGIDRVNGSGLLGDVNLLRGDTSGGYSLRIHRYASQPIIESLGLNVAATEEGSEGASVAILKPVFPYWTDIDLLYGAGNVVCSRAPAHDHHAAGGWLDEQRDALRPKAASSAASSARSPQAAKAAPGALANDYNNALGAATQSVTGPFEFPDVTLQVYPLLADRARLDACVAQYLNQPLAGTGLHFETFGSYVYLMVSVTGDQIGTMWSSTNNIGWWAEREVSFCIPVKWYRNGELLSVGLVAPFVYANNNRAVITDREVNGRPTIEAAIESPQDVWLGASGPNEGRRFLHMSTEVFPALHLGTESEQRTLLEIDERGVLPYSDDVGWRMVAESWGREMVDDLKRRTAERIAEPELVQDAKALALELLAHEAPINSINLKQYRDAGDVGLACYQAAVHTKRTISRIYDIREIEQNVHVRIHQLSGHPIVDVLGLKVKTIDSKDGMVVENLQPMRPFWMRVSMRADLADVIAWRCADDGWHVTHPRFAPGAKGDDFYFRGDGAARVGRWLGRPQGLWQRLRDSSIDWLRGALAHELATLRERPPADRDAVLDRLADADRADLQRYDAAPATFVDATSVERLSALVQSLHAVQVTPASSAAPDAGPAAEGEEATLAAWMDTTKSRLTKADARAAIAGIDEVQTVIDAILSDEWENWGNPRRYRNLPPKPEQCVPSSSVYGGSWILKDHAKTFEQEHGLAKTDDGSCWYVLSDPAPAAADEAPPQQ